jgi:hypothetical protein
MSSEAINAHRLFFRLRDLSNAEIQNLLIPLGISPEHCKSTINGSHLAAITNASDFTYFNVNELLFQQSALAQVTEWVTFGVPYKMIVKVCSSQFSISFFFVIYT